jgi:hypothetical protein
MIIRNLASKTKILSTPLGVTRQAERSRGHLALKITFLKIRRNGRKQINCKVK